MSMNKDNNPNNKHNVDDILDDIAFSRQQKKAQDHRRKQPDSQKQKNNDNIKQKDFQDISSGRADLPIQDISSGRQDLQTQDIYSKSPKETNQSQPDDNVKPKKPKRVRVRYNNKVRGVLISAISLLCVFSIVFIGGGAYALSLFGNIYSNVEGDYWTEAPSLAEHETGGSDTVNQQEINDNAIKVSEIEVLKDSRDVQNILLVGVDARDKSFTGLSDAMIILTINNKKGTLRLTSLLRDTYSAIAGRDTNGDGQDDYEKLTHAYAYGGFQTLSKTIEQNFRIKIDKHVAVNFQVFKSTIDLIGGVDVMLSAADAKFLGKGSSEGMYHLNGEQSLKYVRSRRDSDYNRTARQRNMINAMLAKAKTMGIPTMISVFNQISNNISTNMSANELLGYITRSGTYLGYDMEDGNYFPPHGHFYAKILPKAGWVQIINDPVTSILWLHHLLTD